MHDGVSFLGLQRVSNVMVVPAPLGSLAVSGGADPQISHPERGLGKCLQTDIADRRQKAHLHRRRQERQSCYQFARRVELVFWVPNAAVAACGARAPGAQE